MRSVYATDGTISYELEPHEVSFLGNMIVALQARSALDPNVVADVVQRNRYPTSNPDIARLQNQLFDLQAKLAALPPPLPAPDLTGIEQEIADLKTRINNFNPNYGAF